jgi:hypothetical protein
VTGPVFLLAALADGELLYAPLGTPHDLAVPGWRAAKAPPWPRQQPQPAFEAVPGVTGASVVMMLADGTQHRFWIDRPDGAVFRYDDPRFEAGLPDLAFGPDPPVILPRAFPVQIAFAFAVPLLTAGAITYTWPAPGGPPRSRAQNLGNLGLAIMERQAVLNRVRDLCTSERAFGAAVRAEDILQILDDPDPLGHA